MLAHRMKTKANVTAQYRKYQNRVVVTNNRIFKKTRISIRERIKSFMP